MKKKLLTKEGKDLVEKLWRILKKNMYLSWETGASILGFILVQFLVIFFLRGFINLFVLWAVELTKYSIDSIYPLTKVLWLIYIVWFFINIILRLFKTKYYWEEKKQ